MNTKEEMEKETRASETRAKVARTRQELMASELPRDTKDNLHDMLDVAEQATNGHPDKLQKMSETLLLVAVHMVKDSVRLPLAMKGIVSTHATSCQLALPNGWRGLVVRVAWPAAVLGSVVAISPHCTQILETLAKILK